MPLRATVTFHMQAIASILPRFGASAYVSVGDCVLDVRARGRHYRLEPQFTRIEAGELQYTPLNEANVIGFIGWRPYFNKRWPAGSGKLAFKDFCRSKELPTPRFDRAGPAGMPAFLVKPDKSSFGLGMRGPFRDRSPVPVPADGYYEEFIAGRILKASYWDAKLVCLEAQVCPSVKGDGKRTARELISGAFRLREMKQQWDHYQDMVVFQGKSLDSVLAAQEGLLVDCRFQSNFVRDYDPNANVLDEAANQSVVRQLREWGPVFLESVPQALRTPGIAYTVDAVVDAQERVWLLEMNCNPGLHPDVYLGMFEGLFGPAAEPLAPMPVPHVEPQQDWAIGREGLTVEEIVASARFCLEGNRADEALRKLKPLIAGPHPHLEALGLAGRAYARLRLSDAAQDCYRRYLAARPDSLVESLELGLTHFEKGENQQAGEIWRGILQREPQHPPALFYSGLLAANEGRVADARLHLETLSRAAPSDNLYAVRARDLLRDLERDSARSH